MSWLLLSLLALLAALFDHSLLAAWPLAPRACLALAAWSLAGGEQRLMLGRVLLIGLITDAADPGSRVFHSVVLLGIGLAYRPFKPFIFARSPSAWFVVSILVVLLVDRCDAALGGFPLDWSRSLAEGVLAALLVLPLAFLCGVFPLQWHPLGSQRT